MTEFFKFIEKIREGAKERLKNPLIFAFLCAWVIMNWQPIFIFLYSKKPIEERISYLQSEYENYWYLYFTPFIAAIFYQILIPSIMLFIEAAKSELHMDRARDKIKANEEIKKLQIEIDTETKRNELKLLKDKGIDIDYMNNKIETLSNSVTELTDEISTKDEIIASMEANSIHKDVTIQELREELDSIRKSDYDKLSEQIEILRDKMNYDSPRIISPDDPSIKIAKGDRIVNVDINEKPRNN